MRKLDAETWRAASPYLDEVMELPDSERPRWLAALGCAKPDIAAAVAQFLDDFRAVTDDKFLDEPLDLEAWQGLAGMTLGGYRLVAPIGDGGMGSVWLAARSDGRYQARVAVKLLNPGLLGHAVQQRFTREGTILATLSHPNIAHLIDAGVTANGQPYLVLEHVDGEPIDQYCHHRSLSLDERVRLFLDVLAPVAHAHAHLIVHRDLKPSNVFVSRDGQVKLLDFGIAKLLTTEAAGGATEMTRDGGALTPAYAAPEQLTGGAVTTATDVYALGVLLYVLLENRHPFAGALGSPATLLHATTTLEPPSLARYGDLDPIVHKALKKNPEERYLSVVALAEDLRRYLADEPISARPDALTYRAGKFVRRNRTAVALSGLVAVTLVAGLAGTMTQARLATAQADIASSERDFAMRQLSRAEAMNDLNNFLLTEAAPSDESFTVGDLLARAEAAVAQQHARDPVTRVEMLVSIGRQYASQDESENERRVLQTAYALASTLDDQSTKARAACAYGSALSKFGDGVRAEALVAEGLAHLTDQQHDALAHVFCQLRGAEIANEYGKTAKAVERATTAERMLTTASVGSPLLQLRVLLNVAESYRRDSRSREADAAFARALTQLTALGYERTETAETLFNNWALVMSDLGRPADAESLYRRAIAVSSADGTDARVSPFVLNNLARVLADQAHYDEAGAYAARAYAKGVASGTQIVVMQSLIVRAAVYRGRGDLTRAGDMVREIETRAATLWDERHPGRVALAVEHAEMAADRGDFETAIELASQALHAAEQRDEVLVLPRILMRRANIALAANRAEQAHDDAERALRMFQATVGGEGKSLLIARAAQVQGRALMLLGRRDEARRKLTLAANHFTVVGPDHPQRRRVDEDLARLAQ